MTQARVFVPRLTAACGARNKLDEPSDGLLDSVAELPAVSEWLPVAQGDARVDPELRADVMQQEELAVQPRRTAYSINLDENRQQLSQHHQQYPPRRNQAEQSERQSHQLRRTHASQLEPQHQQPVEDFPGFADDWAAHTCNASVDQRKCAVTVADVRACAETGACGVLELPSDPGGIFKPTQGFSISWAPPDYTDSDTDDDGGITLSSTPRSTTPTANMVQAARASLVWPCPAASLCAPAGAPAGVSGKADARLARWPPAQSRASLETSNSCPHAQHPEAHTRCSSASAARLARASVAASYVQAWWRSRVAHRVRLFKLEAVRRLQRAYRQHCRRKSLSRLISRRCARERWAALQVQRWWRTVRSHRHPDSRDARHTERMLGGVSFAVPFAAARGIAGGASSVPLPPRLGQNLSQALRARPHAATDETWHGLLSIFSLPDGSRFLPRAGEATPPAMQRSYPAAMPMGSPAATSRHSVAGVDAVGNVAGYGKPDSRGSVRRTGDRDPWSVPDLKWSSSSVSSSSFGGRCAPASTPYGTTRSAVARGSAVNRSAAGDAVAIRGAVGDGKTCGSKPAHVNVNDLVLAVPAVAASSCGSWKALPAHCKSSWSVAQSPRGMYVGPCVSAPAFATACMESARMPPTSAAVQPWARLR